jgi:hypothetical protein
MPQLGGALTDARADKIAYLHAFADWLAMHPDAPVPTMVIATYHVTAQDEVDEWTRVAGVMSIAQRLGVQMSEGVQTVQGDLDICTPAQHGLTVVYRLAAHKDDIPVQRYLSR